MGYVENFSARRGPVVVVFAMGDALRAVQPEA